MTSRHVSRASDTLRTSFGARAVPLYYFRGGSFRSLRNQSLACGIIKALTPIMRCLMWRLRPGYWLAPYKQEAAAQTSFAYGNLSPGATHD